MLSFLGIVLLFTLPGYLVLGQRFKDGERLALSSLASLVLYGVFAVFAKVSGLSITYALVVVPLTAIIYRRHLTLKIPADLAKVYLVSLLVGLFVSYISPYPNTDGVFQILAGKSFLTDEWMTLDVVDNYFMGVDYPQPISYRPPLNNMGLGLAYSVFGCSYQTAKYYSAYFVASLATIIYMIGKILFDEKTALWGALFLASVNPYIQSMGYDVQVYHVAAYATLCFLYIWIKKKKWPYLAVSAAALYLIHPSCMVFLATVIGYEIIKRGRDILGCVDKRVPYAIVVFVLLCSPWFVRNQMLFSNPLYTSGRYAMFYRSWEDHFRLNPPDATEYLGYIMDPVDLLLIKGGSILKTMVPPPYSATYSRINPFALIDPVSLQYSIAGILSYPLFFVSIYYALRNRRELIPFLFWAAFAASLMVFGFRHDYERSLMLAQVLLVGIYGLSKVVDRRWMITLITLFILFESIGLYTDRLSREADDAATDWIMKNVGEDSIIMSRQPLMINYLTGRKTIVTPYENSTTISDTIQRYGIEYFMVSKEDLRLRDINLGYLNQTYAFRKKTRDYWIYEV